MQRAIYFDSDWLYTQHYSAIPLIKKSLTPCNIQRAFFTIYAHSHRGSVAPLSLPLLRPPRLPKSQFGGVKWLVISGAMAGGTGRNVCRWDLMRGMLSVLRLVLGDRKSGQNGVIGGSEQGHRPPAVVHRPPSFSHLRRPSSL